MIGSHQLDICWDKARLQSDLAEIEHQPWTPHYNEVYRGDWSGLALRSVPNAALQLAGHEVDASKFRDTELLRRTPYFRELLSFFQCPHPDSDEKHDEATPSLRNLAAQMIESPYLELENHPRALR